MRYILLCEILDVDGDSLWGDKMSKNTVIVSVLGQKGGSGKSFVVGIVAREFAAADWSTKIADLDIKQGTSTDWNRRRLSGNLIPTISVEAFRTIEQALKNASHYDMFILDTPGHSSNITLTAAKNSDYILIPTGPSLDDLKPSVLLAHELVKNGVVSDRMAFVLSKVGDSQNEVREAREYIEKAGYIVLDGELPYKTMYRRSVDSGKAATETSHPGLRLKAETVAQNIVNFVTQHLSQQSETQVEQPNEEVNYGYVNS